MPTSHQCLGVALIVCLVVYLPMGIVGLMFKRKTRVHIDPYESEADYGEQPEWRA